MGFDLLIQLIIMLVVGVVVIYVIDYVSGLIPLPAIVWLLLKILVGLAMLIYLLKLLGVLAGFAVH